MKHIKLFEEIEIKEIMMIENGKINESLEFIKPTKIGLDLVNHKSGYTIDLINYE